MTYDFHSLIRRDALNSSKWALMAKQNPQHRDDVVPLSVADMELRNPPEITEGLKDFLDGAILGYTYAGESFLNSVVQWMARRHNWAIEPQWIVNTPGVVTALANAVRAFTEEGDNIILFSPVYYPFTRITEGNKRRVLRSPLLATTDPATGETCYTIDFENFEALAREERSKMLIFCSPHNPIGRVWTEEELRHIAEIALRHDLLVVSDEIHHDLILPGHEHHVLAALVPELKGQLITCTSPSKTFNLAGMQVSNIIIEDEGLRERFREGLMSMALGGLGILAYEACEIAYTRCEPWLEELLQLIDHNQRVVRDFFRDQFPAIKAPLIEGTYLQWIDFRALGLEPEALERFMHEEAQFFTDEGYIFGEEGRGFERVNLALPTDALRHQLELLGEALEELKK